MQKIIIGCGYLGRRVAASCMERGDQVIGVVRSPASAETLRAMGLKAWQSDLDQPFPSLPPLAETQLFYFAPPPREGSMESRVANLADCCSAQQVSGAERIPRGGKP